MSKKEHIICSFVVLFHLISVKSDMNKEWLTCITCDLHSLDLFDWWTGGFISRIKSSSLSTWTLWNDKVSQQSLMMCDRSSMTSWWCHSQQLKACVFHSAGFHIFNELHFYMETVSHKAFFGLSQLLEKLFSTCRSRMLSSTVHNVEQLSQTLNPVLFVPKSPQ